MTKKSEKRDQEYWGWSRATAVAAVVAALAAIYQGIVTQQSLRLTAAALNATLAQTRPFLMLYSSIEKDVFIVRVLNWGSVPGRMTAKSVGMWTDRKREESAAPMVQPKRSVVFPESDMTIARFGLDEHAVRDRLARGNRIGVGVCVTYETVEPGDHRRWVGHLWSELVQREKGLEVHLIEANDELRSHNRLRPDSRNARWMARRIVWRVG